MTTVSIIGYTNAPHVTVGGDVSVHVSTDVPDFTARLVRLSANPAEVEAVDGFPIQHYVGSQQSLNPGSYMTVDGGVVCPSSPQLELWLWPTRPVDRRDQGLMCWGSSHGLFLNEAGYVVGRWGRSSVRSEKPLISLRWSHIVLSQDGPDLRLDVKTYDGGERRSLTTASYDHDGKTPATKRFCLAAVDDDNGVSNFYNGKISRPEICDGGDVVARWSMGTNPPEKTVVDMGPDHRHGLLHNRPQKGMTGPDWQGDSNGWREAPDEYDAIAFHCDDLSDANWPESFTLTIPSDLPSDLYGIELVNDRGRDVVPLYVTPRFAEPTAKLAFIVPTFSYLAYANERHWWTNPGIQDITGKTLDEIVGSYDRWGQQNNLISCYDYHRDGTGNAHASLRRPLVNVRADYQHPLLQGPHQLSGDVLTIEWLRRIGQPFDILTDHYVHAHGVDALASYKAVMTGSHPEYVSRDLYDAVDQYLEAGGSLIHTGGNAFYFVVSLYPDEPHIMEVRRNLAGTIPWQSAPGEMRQAATGELGGLWRWRGRSAHGLLGTGTAAVTFGKGSDYLRSPESYDPHYAWIFDGVRGDRVTAISVLLEAAAGFEVDAMRHDLGTPTDTVRLATASDFGPMTIMACEDVLTTGQNGSLSTDIVYRKLPGGGQLFAAPSISWTGCLGDNDGNNHVAIIMRNVLKRFMDSGAAQS